MTKEEAIQVLSMVEAHGTLVIQAKEMAIEALKQELEKQGCKVIDPSGSSSEKPNKSWQWIERVERDDWDDSEEVWYECNQCHLGSERASNYCPNCGAKMIESQEGSGEE